MARVKRGTTKNKSRKYTLAQTKGFRHGRKSKKRQAYEAIAHAGNHAFNHRKDKKARYRQMWQNIINFAVRKHDLSYSKFIDLLNKKEAGINRKMLADIAKNNPSTFERIVKSVQ